MLSNVAAVNMGTSSFLLNKSEPEKMVEINSRLFRKYEPIYYVSESNVGRAHFFAPYKKIGGLLIDTFTFNLTVIWLMTLFLYIFLLSNVLGKIIKTIQIEQDYIIVNITGCGSM